MTKLTSILFLLCSVSIMTHADSREFDGTLAGFYAQQCKSKPKGCLDGKPIIFDSAMTYDYRNECSRGTVRLRDCTGSDKNAECRIAKILSCRFCKPQGDGVYNYKNLDVDNTLIKVSIDADVCRSLEATDTGSTKFKLSYKQICGYRNQLSERAKAIYNKLAEKSRLTTFDAMIADISNWKTDVENLIFGNDGRVGKKTKGLLETIDTFGDASKSVTMKELRQFTAEANNVWSETIVLKSTTLQNDDDARVLSDLIVSLMGSYRELANAYHNNIAYKPQGAEEALSCDATEEEIEEYKAKNPTFY